MKKESKYFALNQDVNSTRKKQGSKQTIFEQVLSGLFGLFMGDVTSKIGWALISFIIGIVVLTCPIVDDEGIELKKSFVAYSIAVVLIIFSISLLYSWLKNRNLSKLETSILLKNGASLNIDRDILDYAEIDAIIVVLTNPLEYQKMNNENVYAFNFEGEQLWQIEDIDLLHNEHPYTSIFLKEEELYAYNRCGVEVKIVAETGQVVSTELVK
jgi:hypothetical protein